MSKIRNTNTRQLVLHRETICNLTSSELPRIVGGAGIFDLLVELLTLGCKSLAHKHSAEGMIINESGVPHKVECAKPIPPKKPKSGYQSCDYVDGCFIGK